MLIKNFSHPIDTINDINNITERRRFVIVYKYHSPHQTIFELYNDNNYDLYVINTSTIIGVDYIIPKNIIVQCKNNYRGCVKSPFNSDGTFNMNALCEFNNSYYSSRIVNGKEILRYTKKDIIEFSELLDYISSITKSDLICPFPEYYNIEHQARFNKAYYNEMDFDNISISIPSYTLNDFRDERTAYVSLDINDDFIIQDKPIKNSGLVSYKYRNEVENLYRTLSDYLITVLVECYEHIMKTIFSQVYIIIDLDSGLFTVDKDSLRIKYSYNVSNEEFRKEFSFLVSLLSDKAESCSDVFNEDLMCSNISEYITLPTRLTMFISPTLCKMRLSNPDINKLNREKLYIPNMLTERSSSDVDELALSVNSDNDVICGIFDD
jgi:hypothetical protein